MITYACQNCGKLQHVGEKVDIKAKLAYIPPGPVVNVGRKYRLSGRELTKLAKDRWVDSYVTYEFKDRIGWYVHLPSRKKRIFIGVNWIEARDYITRLSRLPSSS